MGSEESRYAAVSRRALIRGVTAAAALGAAGCSSGDKQVFVSPSVTDAAPSSTGDPGSAAPVGKASGPPLPASAKMAITFTFAAGASNGGPGGPARNPYIAVWIEDGGEELVSTVSLWHMQQNERWLGELKRWYQVSGGYETATSATRVAGTYTVTWDGTGRDAGGKVPAGQYWVCIEAAREHGPYELIREPIVVGTAPAQKTFQPNQELTAASAKYTV